MNHLERQTYHHFPSHFKEEKEDFKHRSRSCIKTTTSEPEASPPAARRPRARAEPAVPSPPCCRSRIIHPVQIPMPSCREGAHGLAARSGMHRTLQCPSPGGSDSGREVRTPRPAAIAKGARPGGIAAGFPVGFWSWKACREPWTT